MSVINKEFTIEEHMRLKKNLCLKCGKRITEQTYYGSLCVKCNELYFPFDARNKENMDSTTRFLMFIRDNKEKVMFT